MAQESDKKSQKKENPKENNDSALKKTTREAHRLVPGRKRPVPR